MRQEIFDWATCKLDQRNFIPMCFTVEVVCRFLGIIPSQKLSCKYGIGEEEERVEERAIEELFNLDFRANEDVKKKVRGKGMEIILC